MTEYTRLRNKNRGYEVENNLWKLLESLEKKRDDGTWVTRASDNIEKHHPDET